MPNQDNAMSWTAEFKKFLKRGNVVELAVGIVMGAAFQHVVASLVEGVFSPVASILVPVQLNNWFYVVKCQQHDDKNIELNHWWPFNCQGQTYSTMKSAKNAGATYFDLGTLTNAIIEFLIVALVLFWIIKAYNRMFHVKGKAKCTHCIQEVDRMASRCNHCAGTLTPQEDSFIDVKGQ